MSKTPDQACEKAAPKKRWNQKRSDETDSPRSSDPTSQAEVQPLSAATIEAYVQALGDRNPPVARQAARNLENLGTEALQPLLDALKNPFAERNLLKAIAHTLVSVGSTKRIHHLIEQLLCGESRSQCEAAEAISELGQEGAEAIPALVWSLRKAQTTKVREAVAQTLGDLGVLLPEVVPALVQVLESDFGNPEPAVNPHPETHAEPTAPTTPTAPTAAALAAEMKNNAEASSLAAKALSRIGTPPATAALLHALQTHSDIAVRRTVAEGLGTITPPDPEVIRPLVEAWHDGAPPVREAATKALMAIGEVAVSELAKALRHESLEVRRHAAEVLGRMAATSGKALDALVNALKDEDGCVIVHAAVAILKIYEANPALLQTRQKKPSRSPKANVPENEQALTVLAEVVRRKDGQRETRQHAAEALGRVGAGVKLVYQILAEVSADESDHRLVRGSAQWALQRLGPEQAHPAEPK